MNIVQNRIRLINNLPSNLGFSNVLANDVSTEEFRNTRLLFDGRLNLQLHFENESSKSSFGIGITGGYRWDPFSTTYRYERSSVKIDIPGTRQSGLMFGLFLTIKGPKLTPPKPNTKQERS